MRMVCLIRFTTLYLLVLLSCPGLTLAISQESDPTHDDGIFIQEKTVRGDSLSPLLEPGQRIRIIFGYYKYHPIQRDDVVAYIYDLRKPAMIKIVKALPSDKVEIKEADGERCHVLINGAIMVNSQAQPYLLSKKRAQRLYSGVMRSAGVMPQDRYIIMGDKVGASRDSTLFGTVTSKYIVGRVVIGEDE